MNGGCRIRLYWIQYSSINNSIAFLIFVYYIKTIIRNLYSPNNFWDKLLFVFFLSVISSVSKVSLNDERSFFCKYTFYNRLQIASQTIQFYHIPNSLPIILTVHNILVYHNIKIRNIRHS